MRLATLLSAIVGAVSAYGQTIAPEWIQAYSNWAVQSTLEQDWKCVRVFANQTSPDHFTFVKEAVLHGGTKRVRSFTYSAEKLANNTVILRNPALSAPLEYTLREMDSDMAVFTGDASGTLFVWTTRSDGVPPEKLANLLLRFQEWGWNQDGPYKAPLSSYDFKKCEAILANADPLGQRLRGRS